MLPAAARVVALDASRLDALLALSTAAHWNQGVADWRVLLELGHGWGVAVADEGGREVLAASTLVLPYDDRFAWISMVLVLPGWRGRGLARRLLEVALDDLSRRGLAPVLDATPAGHPVYRKQGFRDAWGFARWRRPADADAPPARRTEPRAPAGCALRPLLEADWGAIAALDAPAFGASRLPVLRHLARRLPAAAWVLEDDRGPCGFVFGRDGRTAAQLGPLVAADEAAARALLGAALRALRLEAGGTAPALIVDLRERLPLLQQWLQEHGFAFERSFTRMVRGALSAPGDPARVMLVAGPELG